SEDVRPRRADLPRLPKGRIYDPKDRQKHGPSFSIRSKDMLFTLEKNYFNKRLDGDMIRRAVFKITFPDDKRGKRVELAGTNKVKFKRATHAEDVFRYLKNWGIVKG
ncbi:MAG: hypothetical protein ACREA0_10690, partial [bacterium]